MSSVLNDSHPEPDSQGEDLTAVDQFPVLRSSGLPSWFHSMLKPDAPKFDERPLLDVKKVQGEKGGAVPMVEDILAQAGPARAVPPPIPFRPPASYQRPQHRMSAVPLPDPMELGAPLSMREVAELIGCSVSTVRQSLIPRGLPHFRSGATGKLIFYTNQVIRWIESQQQRTPRR